MTALGSGIISCTALDKTLGVRPPDTLITESPSVVAPGASLGKLFLVTLESEGIKQFLPHHNLVYDVGLQCLRRVLIVFQAGVAKTPKIQ